LVDFIASVFIGVTIHESLKVEVGIRSYRLEGGDYDVRKECFVLQIQTGESEGNGRNAAMVFRQLPKIF
jgi:hypothetical protein